MNSNDTEKQLRISLVEPTWLGLISLQKLTDWLNRTTWLIWDLETLLTEET